MSKKNDTASVIMSWQTLLGLSEQATKAAKEHGERACIVMGLGAWTLAREVFEDRLREPFIADCAIIDGVEMRPSFHLEPPQILVMPHRATVREIPLVVEATPNDLTLET